MCASCLAKMGWVAEHVDVDELGDVPGKGIRLFCAQVVANLNDQEAKAKGERRRPWQNVRGRMCVSEPT